MDPVLAGFVIGGVGGAIIKNRRKRAERKAREDLIDFPQPKSRGKERRRKDCDSLFDRVPSDTTSRAKYQGSRAFSPDPPLTHTRELPYRPFNFESQSTRRNGRDILVPAEKKPWERGALTLGKKPWERDILAAEKKPWERDMLAIRKKPWERDVLAIEKKPWERPIAEKKPWERDMRREPPYLSPYPPPYGRDPLPLLSRPSGDEKTPATQAPP